MRSLPAQSTTTVQKLLLPTFEEKLQAQRVLNSQVNYYIEQFVCDSIASGNANAESSVPEREPVRMILIGSREGVTEQMHILYQKGYAHVDEWSPLQPTGKIGEVIAVLIRYYKRLLSNTRKSGQ